MVLEFLSGVLFCVAVAYGPSVKQLHDFLGDIYGYKSVFRTGSLLVQSAAIYVEQATRQYLKYEPRLKVYILSYYLKGKLHQIYVRPTKGPEYNKLTAEELGYSSIVMPEELKTRSDN